MSNIKLKTGLTRTITEAQKNRDGVQSNKAEIASIKATLSTGIASNADKSLSNLTLPIANVGKVIAVPTSGTGVDYKDVYDKTETDAKITAAVAAIDAHAKNYKGNSSNKLDLTAAVTDAMLKAHMTYGGQTWPATTQDAVAKFNPGDSIFMYGTHEYLEGQWNETIGWWGTIYQVNGGTKTIVGEWEWEIGQPLVIAKFTPSGSIDLTNYYTKTEADTKLATKQDILTEKITVNTADTPTFTDIESKINAAVAAKRSIVWSNDGKNYFITSNQQPTQHHIILHAANADIDLTMSAGGHLVQYITDTSTALTAQIAVATANLAKDDLTNVSNAEFTAKASSAGFTTSFHQTDHGAHQTAPSTGVSVGDIYYNTTTHKFYTYRQPVPNPSNVAASWFPMDMTFDTSNLAPSTDTEFDDTSLSALEADVI